MDNHNPDLAAAVVLYHPDKEVVENIRRYLPFIDALFIADNSDTPAGWMREEFGGDDRVVFLEGEGNRGIATALNECCRVALDKNYTWILTMDQDSTLNDPQFFADFREVGQTIPAGIFAASYAKPVNTEDAVFVQVDEVITSGNILNLHAWKMVSGFCDKLFIDEVDHDFCARLRLKGFDIYTSSKIYLSHHLGSQLTAYHKKRTENITLTKHMPVRMYYITRNTLYLYKTYFFSHKNLARTRLKQLFVRLYQVWMFYPDKKQYYPYIIRGFKDFLRSRYGKYKA